MPNPNAVVDGIANISPSIDDLVAELQPYQFATITFQGGQSGLLDMMDPRSVVWADVLDSLRQDNEPAYVEIDPEANIITELFCPLTVTIGAITPTAAGDGVEIGLVISHAHHYLRRTNPDYQQFLEILQAVQAQGTMVVVTETPDTHEIIDVRLLPQAPVSTEPMPPSEPGHGPASAPVTITPQRARYLFDMVNGKTCCPASAAAQCIPFLYPDDGCWGRAHEMCRLMIAEGAQPEKVWIYGNLRAGSPNHPMCRVRWGWHVTPTLIVNTGSTAEVQVIDPSLFQEPVTQASWASVQGDSSATVESSSAAVFYRNQGGAHTEYDTNYSKTNGVLKRYLNRLKLRSVGPDGPPPYNECLSKPKGVQAYGVINPGATWRGFTWGWPASWHVLWTIMPMTPCPGGPRLSWTTQVERANATQCTYWITVKNLTSNPMRFEVRYDILSR